MRAIEGRAHACAGETGVSAGARVIVIAGGGVSADALLAESRDLIAESQFAYCVQLGAILGSAHAGAADAGISGAGNAVGAGIGVVVGADTGAADAGIVGAGGNAGAVAAGFLFKSEAISWPTALFMLGALVTCCSFLVFAVRFSEATETEVRIATAAAFTIDPSERESEFEPERELEPELVGAM